MGGGKRETVEIAGIDRFNYQFTIFSFYIIIIIIINNYRERIGKWRFFGLFGCCD